MAVLLTARGPSWLLLAAALPFFIMIVTSAPVIEDEQQHHQLDTYSDDTGCYYNYQHYGEGDRIITNEPCLNCTCHNRMLMCYLRVCPFTKAIGSDCTVEKKADQCCPVITCPEVPVQLLSHQPPSTTMRPQSSSTAVGHRDTYGCTIDSEFFADGAQIPSDHNKPCELCYCIRNHTACVMQECTLNVEGCRPVYQDGVCCPVRYECDYPEDSTTTEPASVGGGLILTTTTTMSPNLGCRYNDDEYADGALIHMDDKPCEHCYCMRGDIVCAVQECGTPLEKEGHNCTALPPQPGKCCPEMYQCDTGIEYVTDASFRMNRKQYGNTYDDSLNEPVHDDIPQVNDPLQQQSEANLDIHENPLAEEEQTDADVTKPVDETEIHTGDASGVALDAGSDQDEENVNEENNPQQEVEANTEKQSDLVASEISDEGETGDNDLLQETHTEKNNNVNEDNTPEAVTTSENIDSEQSEVEDHNSYVTAGPQEITQDKESTVNVNNDDQTSHDPNEHDEIDEKPTDKPQEIETNAPETTDSQDLESNSESDKPEIVETENNIEEHPVHESDAVQSDDVEISSVVNEIPEIPSSPDDEETELPEMVTESILAHEEKQPVIIPDGETASHATDSETPNAPSTEVTESVSDVVHETVPQSDAVDIHNEMEVMHEINEPAQKPEVDNLINENIPINSMNDKVTEDSMTDNDIAMTESPSDTEDKSEKPIQVVESENSDVPQEQHNVNQDHFETESENQPQEESITLNSDNSNAPEMFDNSETAESTGSIQQNESESTSTDKTSIVEAVTGTMHDIENIDKVESITTENSEDSSVQHDNKPLHEEGIELETTSNIADEQQNIATEKPIASDSDDQHTEDEISNDAAENTELDIEIPGAEISGGENNVPNNDEPNTLKPETEYIEQEAPEFSTSMEMHEPVTAVNESQEKPQNNDKEQYDSNETEKSPTLVQHSTESPSEAETVPIKQQGEIIDNQEESTTTETEASDEKEVNNSNVITGSETHTNMEQDSSSQVIAQEQMQSEATTEHVAQENLNVDSTTGASSSANNEESSALQDSTATENGEEMNNIFENSQQVTTDASTNESLFEETQPLQDDQEHHTEITKDPETQNTNEEPNENHTEENSINHDNIVPEFTEGSKPEDTTSVNLAFSEEDKESSNAVTEDTSNVQIQDTENNLHLENEENKKPQISTDTEIANIDSSDSEHDSQHDVLSTDKPVEISSEKEPIEEEENDLAEPEKDNNEMQVSNTSEMVQTIVETTPQIEVVASDNTNSQENTISGSADSKPSENEQNESTDHQIASIEPQNDPKPIFDNTQQESVGEVSLEEGDLPLSGIGAMHDVQTPSKEPNEVENISIVEQVTSSSLPMDSDSLTHEFDKNPQDHGVEGVALDAGQDQAEQENTPVPDKDENLINDPAESEHPIEIPVQDEKPIWTDKEQDDKIKPVHDDIDFQQHIPSISGIHISDSHPAMQDAEETNPDHFGDDLHLQSSQEPNFAEEPTHINPGTNPVISEAGNDNMNEENEHGDAPTTAASIDLPIITDLEHMESSTTVPTEIEKHPAGKPESDISDTSSEEVTEAGEEESSSETIVTKPNETETPVSTETVTQGECLVDGVVFSNGSPIQVANPCQESCVCEKGIVHCTLRPCPSPPSNNPNCMPMYRDGSCCPVYTCVDESGQVIETGSASLELTEIPVDLDSSTVYPHESTQEEQDTDEHENPPAEIHDDSQMSQDNSQAENESSVDNATEEQVAVTHTEATIAIQEESENLEETPSTDSQADNQDSKPENNVNIEVASNDETEIPITDMPETPSTEVNNANESQEEVIAENEENNHETPASDSITLEDEDNHNIDDQQLVVEPVVAETDTPLNHEMQQQEITTTLPLQHDIQNEPVQSLHENDITVGHVDTIPIQDSNDIPIVGSEGSLNPDANVEETTADVIGGTEKPFNTDVTNDENIQFEPITEMDPNESSNEANVPMSESTESSGTQHQEISDNQSFEQIVTDQPEIDDLVTPSHDESMPDITSDEKLPTDSQINKDVESVQHNENNESTVQHDDSTHPSVEETVTESLPVSSENTQENQLQDENEPSMDHISLQPQTDDAPGVALNAGEEGEEESKPATPVQGDSIIDMELPNKQEQQSNQSEPADSQNEENGEKEPQISDEESATPAVEQVDVQKPELDQSILLDNSEPIEQQEQQDIKPENEYAEQTTVVPASQEEQHPEIEVLNLELTTVAPASHEQESLPDSDHIISQDDSQISENTPQTEVTNIHAGETEEISSHDHIVVQNPEKETESPTLIEEEQKPEVEEVNHEIGTEAPEQQNQEVDHSVESITENNEQIPVQDHEATQKPEIDVLAEEIETEAPFVEQEAEVNTETAKPSETNLADSQNTQEQETPENELLSQNLVTETPEMSEQEAEQSTEEKQPNQDITSDSPAHHENEHNPEPDVSSESITEEPVKQEIEEIPENVETDKNTPQSDSLGSGHEEVEIPTLQAENESHDVETDVQTTPVHEEQHAVGTEAPEFDHETEHKPESNKPVLGDETHLPSQETDHKPSQEYSTEESVQHEEDKTVTEQTISVEELQSSTHEQEQQVTEQPASESSTDATNQHEPEELHKPESELTTSEDESEVPTHHEQEIEQKPDIPQYPDPIFTDDDEDMGGFPGTAPEPGTDFMPPMPSYEDEDQQAAFGPGTCRYGGKVYVSAQQIPRDDPCDFCFCFRSDIICLQQSCPPPIKGCHEEAIEGFCCPRYECPVPMGLMNSTTTTTTTTTLPPDLISSYIYGRRESTGCLVQGTLYRIGEEITTASGPCLECRCGGDSKMKCEPKACSPQPMLRKMIEAVSLRR